MKPESKTIEATLVDVNGVNLTQWKGATVWTLPATKLDPSSAFPLTLRHERASGKLPPEVIVISLNKRAAASLHRKLGAYLKSQRKKSQ